MKKILIIFVLINSFSFSQYYPRLTELRGLEDSLGNTHLFYRQIYASSGCWSKSIWHLDVRAQLDTFFIMDGGGIVYPGGSCEGPYINDYEFFNNDPAKFIYCGYELWIDPVAKLVRYDGEIPIGTFVLTEIEISMQDENKVYISEMSALFKSTDGGYNFEFIDTTQVIDISLISLSRNDDSQIYGIDDNKLVRSENDGHSYIIVDNSDWSENTQLYYDSDGSHMYGLSNSYNYQTQSYTGTIFISDDNGNPFTWNKQIEYSGNLYFTLDNNQAGEIYYSAGKRIFKSKDFGNSFILYKELDRNITGLYKKSVTNILYASTPHKICEISPDTLNVIKEIPIPDDVFSWFPLSIGNKWIYYSTFHDVLGDSVRFNSTSEVVGYKVISSNVYSEVFVKEIPIEDSSYKNAGYQYFRTDSSEGKIYSAAIENDSLLYEKLYMDLLAEVGDTIPVDNGIYFESEVPFTQFNLDSRKRTFSGVSTPLLDIEIVRGFGVVYQNMWELGESRNVLRGCMINGIVFGDTTIVSVEDESPIINNYRLEQNYPNPFNPTTKIKYQIPKAGLVTLKAYDVLGREVVTIVNEEKLTGNYEVEFGGSNLSSGIYFYRLQAGDFIDTKKFVLIK
jgi:hypothetical protein